MDCTIQQNWYLEKADFYVLRNIISFPLPELRSLIVVKISTTSNLDALSLVIKPVSTTFVSG